MKIKCVRDRQRPGDEESCEKKEREDKPQN